MASCKRQRQRGFSLLEMMTTVTLTGALSATAIAHFEETRSQAEMIRLDAMATSLEQAAYQAWMRAVVDGVHRLPEARVILQNQNVRLVRGYPSADRDGIAVALHVSPQWRIEEEGKSLQVYSTASSRDCHLVYHQPGHAGDVPVIEKVGNNCE